MLASSEDGDSPETLSFSQASDIVELVVLTGDETFLQMLRDAVGGARRLWHVPSPDQVSDLLVAGQVGILVLDAQALHEAAAVFLAQINRQFPDLVVVVAGNRDAEASLAGLISSGIVYRFIHKPMSPGRAKLFADAAVKKYEEQRRLAVVTPPPTAYWAESRLWLIGAGLLALAASVLFWRLHGSAGSSASQEASSKTTAEEPRSPAITREPSVAAAAAGLTDTHERLLASAENALIEERLDDAAAAIDIARKAGVEGGRISFLTAQLNKARERRKAAALPARIKNEPSTAVPAGDDLTKALVLATERMQGGHLIEPDGDSAKFYVERALGMAPDSAAAKASEETLALALLRQARGAIERRDFAHAVSMLDAANGIASPSNVDNLLQELRNARRRAEVDSWGQLLEAGKERLQQDRLVEPANDSAKYYLTTLRGVDPSNPGLAAAFEDLGARFAAKARHALDQQQLDVAHGWLDEATAIGAASAELGAVRRDWEIATARQAFANDIIAADRLKLVKSVPLAYPKKAAEARVEGWVEIDFTVAETGEVKDAVLHAADPPGVFDRSAISALSQWRYVPVMRDSKPVAQRARIRLRFVLKD